MALIDPMNKGQVERLVLLIEECGEVIQAASKVLRHGWEGSYVNGEKNRTSLERELGDVLAILSLMGERNSDIHLNAIRVYSGQKLEKLTASNNRFVYFQ
jgi:NTP pyrophosphatase (non-canonical NTP hydrolase)